MSILSNYTFWVVATGTVLLGLAAGMVGTVSVLKGQSLIGDAIGHSSFPGIVLAFMLFQTRDPLLLMAGALVTGAVAFGFIQMIHSGSKIKLDTALAIVLSSMFGLGMVLKSYITGNPVFSKGSQSGLQNYIFGQAAYMLERDVRILMVVSIFSITILLLFYKELQLFVFDPMYAKTIRFRPNILNVVLLIMTMALITAGLKAVGAILISALLITPCIIAMQWSHRFGRVLIIAGISGAVSAFVGTWISTAAKTSTGPTIIVVMSAIALVSVLIGRNGVIATAIRRRGGGSHE